MSLFSRLFGSGGDKETTAETARITYEGFVIAPNPAKEGGRYRIGATITKTVNEEEKTHTLIRADTLEDKETAVEASIRKAKQVIDEQGERLFG